MINEIGNTPEGQFMLGRLQGRQNQRARGEQTSGRIKQTTTRADEYWRGTNFNDGENFEDPQSWADSYDDYDQYGDFDSEAYERNQQERERDQERQSELYSRVQNKLNKKRKNENKNISKKNTIRLDESDNKIKFALQTLNYYYDYAMECFNDPHRGYPKQAVAKVIQAAKTLLPYKEQGVDVKNALIKAKQLSNLAKREVEIDRKGQEISDNEGGLAYMDYLDSVGKIPMVGESVKKDVINKKRTVKLTESDLKRVISKSVKNILKEGFNSPLPSFAAKEVEPKHRLRKQWDDDYDAMVARNHARGEEFMDDFNKKASLSYGKSLKENQENLPWNNSDIQNDLTEIKRIASYLVNDYLDNVSQEQLDELGDMTQKYRQFLSTFMKQIDSKRW